MRIVFMGTPEFAVPCLDICNEMGEVVLVVTQPDRPKGRGKKLAPPPVKERAEALGLAVFQPERIKHEEPTVRLESLKPDLIVVVAYGQLLSTRLLNIPKMGCINVHASLLPKLRGASPINWSIVTGETETGVTTMYMSEGLDEGDMIDKLRLAITETMTAGELHDQLMGLGSQVLRTTLKGLEEGTAQRVPQQAESVNYAPILKKEMGRIDWNKTAHEISCLIRGFDPWPVAYSYYEDQLMKLFSPTVEMTESSAVPGTILEVGKTGMLVKTADAALRVAVIQMPNGKKMRVSDYILGHSLLEGTILSNNGGFNNERYDV